MNRSVPMLLAIIVLLVVVVLVVLVYNITLTNRLSQGLTPTGTTVGGEALTGVETPTEVLTPASGGAETSHPKTVVLPPNAGKGQAARPGREGGPSGRAGARGRGGRGPQGERGR